MASSLLLINWGISFGDDAHIVSRGPGILSL